jgi:hypothetical protein
MTRQLDNRVAAIWARISGPEQQSLPSQVAEVKEWLEAQGFAVPLERILAVDWTSTDILRCPAMQQLLHWVASKEIAAVGSLHLDRFAARPGQVAQILDTFRQAGVELLLKQSPLPTGLMGELMGLIITIGKALSVERADQGAKRGLHDRPKLYGVPVIYRKPYGYEWEKTPKRLAPDDTIQLLPDENWDVASFICQEGHKGTPSRSMVRKLSKDHIPSPSGNEQWCIQTIVGILRNPVYGGRYYALRRENVEPKKRMGDTYGKSSSRWAPNDQWHYLPQVKVINAPLTWDEWLAVQRRLENNKLLAQRHATHDYLMRGILVCDMHRRRMRGWPYHKKWRYVCPADDGCYHWVPGPDTDERAKQVVALLLNDPEALVQPASTEQTEADLKKEQRSLEMKRMHCLNSLVELERRYNDGSVDSIYRLDDEVYRRLKVQYQTQIQWSTERATELERQLANLQHQAQVASSLEAMRAELSSKLSGFSNAEWRHLFTDLGMVMHLEESGDVVAHFALPYQSAADKAVAIVSSSS